MEPRNLLSQKAAGVSVGVIREMFDKAAKMNDVISMGIGEPDLDTDSRVCRACAEALERGMTHYAPNAGRLELRRAIAKHGLIAGEIYDPEGEIIVTNGGMGALALLMQVLLEPGDGVLVQDPQYLNFATTIELVGGRAIRVPTRFEDGFCPTPEAIRAAYVPGKTKILLLNSPNNPTGEVIPREKLEALARVACELDLLVVSDEVYGTLLYEDAEALSIAALPGMRDRTVVLGSFSKAFAMTGWRIGYAAGPAEIIGCMTRYQEYFNSCINTAAQLGAVWALEHKAELTEAIRLSFEERRALTLGALQEIPGMRTNHPKGAFYCFPDIRAYGMDDVTFCNRLLDEAHVVCVPGSAFGEHGSGFMRLAYTAKKDRLAEGLERLHDFCRAHLNN